MYGFQGMGQAVPDQLDLTGLVPATGPDANQVASLNVGALASQVASSGQYSIDPTTGQLQTNTIPGISNSNLVIVAGLLVGLFFFVKMASR